MTRKRTYLTRLMAQPAQWIAASAASPSPAMTRTHVALHLIELRRRARIASHYADIEIVEGWQ
jgi:hypothetical protein